MSDDQKNDSMPEWLDMDLEWLKDFSAEEPEKTPEPAAFPGTERPRAADPTARTDAPRETAQPHSSIGSINSASGTPERAASRRQAPARTASERTPVRRRAADVPRSVRSYSEETPVMRRNAEEARERRSAEEEYERRRAPRDSYESERRGRRSGGTNKLLIVLIAVLGLGMIFAAWRLSSFLLNYHRDRSAYNDLASSAVIVLEEPEDAAEDTDAAPGAAGGRVVSEVPLSVDWEYLRGINSDIVGWLYCPDTIINYPVVQTEDHDFYLDHGFDRNANTSGTLFADRSSVLGIEQSNYIIYGHNMKDDSMFGTFKEYVNQSYYEAHPTMYYLTPNGCYRIDLICAHIVENTDENFPGYFSNTGDYQSYINQIASESFWVNYDAITTAYQLMTLSTCTSAAGYSDARFVVHGMMVPIQ